MRRRTLLLALLVPLALAGCNDKQAAKIPPPHRMTAEDIGHYCGMNVLEHPGPKGHIFVASLIEPVWFSSVRDTIAFTMLPDEPRDIQAIYVSDMGKAPDWGKPGADNWIDARKALFVIESRAKSGMGGDEAVPFSDRAAAEKFAADNGGRIVGFEAVPRDYVLTSSANAAGAAAADEAPEGPPGERSRRTP
ncbi:nitrous oxide reductase accessory protein NosL [Bradyrhizobium guangxiense]|uniref:nitrous oxide reductase accessory protein NosL n=1 Tax=Bradyrhizobium guangxiense TaxID=1325115 RepID=UPI001008D333|nr:nitrous oxide reductase accessory protein NosL [Bradyrhizobium guangxiense]